MEQALQDQVTQFQHMEQNLQQYYLQRQTLHIQLAELDGALEALRQTAEKPFKIIGSLMVASSKEDLQKDLRAKKETCSIRLKNVEKQETELKQKMEALHRTLIKQIEKK